MNMIRRTKRKLFRKMDCLMPSWLSAVLRMRKEYDSEI